METREFDTLALASITTGTLLVEPFSKMHEACEWVMGHPVWTHEMASGALWQLMRAKILEQHPDLDIDASSVTPENVKAFAAKVVADLGPTREIVKGDEERGADPVTTAKNMLGHDKPIIAIQARTDDNSND